MIHTHVIITTTFAILPKYESANGSQHLDLKNLAEYSMTLSRYIQCITSVVVMAAIFGQ